MTQLGNNLIPLRTPSDIGALVKRRRKTLGLSQMALADQAGVGRRFLIELEDGKSTAQIGKVLCVLSMLGIAVMASES
ncbi:MAG: type II toxin-antitoxin system Y4mF family antitoxin [Stenotrophobium sp.]